MSVAKEKDQFNFIEYINKYKAIIYAELLIISYFYYQAYYNNFNINIASYFNATELIFLFVDKAILIILLFIILTVSIFICISIFESKIEEEIKLVKTSFKKVFKTKTFYFILSAFVFFSIFKYFRPLKSHFTSDSITLLQDFSSFVILSLILLKIIYQKRETLFFKKQIDLRLIFILLVINAISISHEKGRILKETNSITKKVSFSYNKEEIKTNSELKYIGQTNSYLFLFDKLKNETRVYKKDEISNYKIKLPLIYTIKEETDLCSYHIEKYR